jgi:hypothetical protein
MWEQLVQGLFEASRVDKSWGDLRRGRFKPAVRRGPCWTPPGTRVRTAGGQFPQGICSRMILKTKQNTILSKKNILKAFDIKWGWYRPVE